jgi:hypothetical protein
MSGSANKGWLRWCYSLVESSMNDTVRSNGHSVLPPLLCRGPGVESVAGRDGGVLTHCWVLRHQAPANTAEPRALRPTGPSTHTWPARAGPHIEL